MIHPIKPIPFKPHRLVGLPEGPILHLYESDYGQAVRQLNDLQANSDSPNLSPYVSRMETFLDSLGGEDGMGSPAIPPHGLIAEAIDRDFGSFDAWRQHFAAMAEALSGGNGWVLLCWDHQQGRLVNEMMTDDSLARHATTPVLALRIQKSLYGENIAAFIDAFFGNIHWGRPDRRLAHALASEASIGVEELQAKLSAGETLCLIDVCLEEDRPKRYDRIPGAPMHLAELREEWIDTLPTDTPIVAYCMYGFQVSANAVAALRECGFDARCLAGGIAAWRAAGGETEQLT